MLYSFSHTRRQRQNLPLTVDLVGYHHLQEPVIRSNTFTLFQFLYCVEGQGEIIIQGRKSILTPNQMVLFYPHEPHAYHAITPEWRVHIIGFSGSCCMELLKTLRMCESGIYHFGNPNIFQEYFSRIMDIQEQMAQEQRCRQSRKHRSGSAYLVELSKLCYDLLLDLSLSARFVNASAPAGESEAVKTLIAYMSEHYSEPITLDDLAQQVQLSRSYISDLFRKEMQQTIIHYLNNLRISHARVLLIEYPEMRASEVGRLCGFENPSYFGETFKKIVGMTPIAYRMS